MLGRQVPDTAAGSHQDLCNGVPPSLGGILGGMNLTREGGTTKRLVYDTERTRMGLRVIIL